MGDDDTFYSVITPLRDDAEIIEGFVEDLLGVLSTHFSHFELLLVDDGSRDATVEKVCELLTRHDYTRLISLSRRFGQEIAISAGLDSAIGDFVVVMLPDTDPPERIPEMVEIARGGCDVVYGVKTSREGERPLIRWGARLYYPLCRILSGLDIPSGSTHFRVLSRRVVNALIQIRDRSRYLRTLSMYVGYRSHAFQYQTIQRRSNPRDKGVWEALQLAVGIIVANSTQPLRLAGLLAVGACFLNFLYMGYITAIFLFKDDVATGWPTLSMQVSSMLCLLFLILAVLCEYLGRFLDESRMRPLYYLKEEIASSTQLIDEDRRNVVDSSHE